MFALSFEIIGFTKEVPSHLSLRAENLALVASILLAISFLVIAFARLSSKEMIFGMVKAIYKNKNVEKIVQEEYSMSNLSSVFLVLNYIISTSALLFLTIPFKTTIHPSVIFWIFPIPVVLVIMPWITLSLIGWFSGEKNSVLESKINTFLFAHFAGLLYSILLLFWAFNFQWSEFFIQVFLGVTAILWLFRFYRGFIFAFNKGVSWYYIILYFCTLEILPFVLFYVAFHDKINEEFNWLLN